MAKQKSDIISKLDTFTRQYIETALWSENDNADPSGGSPLDSNFSIEDITIDTLKRMAKECMEFQKTNAALLAEHGDYSQAGHDFWLTRNGHGAGFWDRGLGELGEKLTAASKNYGGFHLYINANKIHGESG